MKSKTSPGKVSIIDSDTVSCDGLREGLIVFQLLEMRAPNSSMVQSYGRSKIFDLGNNKITFLVRVRASRPNKSGAFKPSMMSRFGPGTYRFELRGS